MFQRILLSILLMTCHEGNTHTTIDIVPPSFPGQDCLPHRLCNGSSSEKPFHCRCDDLCSVYDDCCLDAPSKELPFETSVTPDDWSCIFPEGDCTYHMYMVTSCPKTADSQLSSKCAQEHPLKDYDFLLDIPVKSSVTGFMYKNMFCAQCHADAQHLEDVTLSLYCDIRNVKTFGILTKMKYNPRLLKWTALHPTGNNCKMVHSTKGRQCYNVKRKCPEVWPYDETRRKCSSHSYMVLAHRVPYKNYFCAICNNIHSDDILCDLGMSRTCGFTHPTLSGIFKFTGECEKAERWNFLSQECEPVSYEENLTNGAIDVNSSGKLCRKGEEQVQVCQEQTAASASVLQLVSTVVICIPLVCMLLYL